MLRRHFLTLPAAASFAGPTAPPEPLVALTIDDFNWRPVAAFRKSGGQSALLGPIAKRKIRAAAFIAGTNCDNPEGRDLVKRWLGAGHLIGNHTYSHRPYFQKSFEEFSADTLRNDEFLRTLGADPKFFRFPMLREGETKDKRDRMRAFLKQQGYANGHVTIDSSDWFIDQRLRASLEKSPAQSTKPYSKFYADHMLDCARRYGAIAGSLNVRPPHALLLHYNVLNALYLDDLMTGFERAGFRWIDAPAAFADPIFRSEPDVLPAGESLLYAMAKEKGVLPKDAPYPGEDGDRLIPAMDKLGL